MSDVVRRLLAGAAAAAVAAAAGPLAAGEDRPVLSFYGTPGLIDMPSARMQPDGELSLTAGLFGATLRNTLTFQITPRISGSFRYALLDGYDGGGTRTRYDRSFDVSVLIAGEGDRMPAIALGLRDFGGTGIYGGEYLVASKSFGPRLSVSGGIGWGRLGSHNGFDNPLGVLHDGFRRRPVADAGGIGTTGQLDFDNWFRGDAALFTGVEWQAGERLVLKAEYSSDAYGPETGRGIFEHRTPFNFGASYRLRPGLDLGVHYLYGAEVGLVLSTSVNPRQARLPGGREGAPPAVRPRTTARALGWEAPEARDSGAGLREAVAAALAEQGLVAEAMELSPQDVTLHLRNGVYDAGPQALGRAARALTRVLPPEIERFTLVPVQAGMPVSAVTVKRSDLEELEGALDGSWQSYVRATVADAAGMGAGRDALMAGAYPDFSWRLNGYVAPALFDPDDPLRADLGAELTLAYAPRPGVVFSTRLRQPIVGSLDEATRRSDSVLPHVRSDAALYAVESGLELTHLTGEYFFRPGRDLYGRVTAGYLEPMYGGLSAEILWKPVNGRLAFGAELNHVRQRDFDMGFGFRDYEVTTGHASAYYDFGGGFLGQFDAGRYLAGDWGATVTLDREFANGWRVGAFFTLTDVPFDTFGEGSFDKGIRLQVPLSWVTGEPARSGFGTTIRPVLRDGGARLEVRNRLHEVVRGYHDPELRERWGRFWR